MPVEDPVRRPVSTTSLVSPLVLTVVEPSGKRREVQVARSPFQIGRLAECDLSLRENRISRHHAQILLEDRRYFIEDRDSRHGLFINGRKVKRAELKPGDRVEFGIQDSYYMLVGMERGFPAPLMKKVAEMPQGTANLGRLSAVLEVARALESSNSVEEVLAAAVDAGLAVTGAERGFLMLRNDKGDLEVRVARDRSGRTLEAAELRVPRGLIQTALLRRRELLSMSIDPELGEGPVETGETVLALELRSVVCVPLVRIRIGLEHETSMVSAKDDTLGLLYMDSKEAPAELTGGKQDLLQSLAIEISTLIENARLLSQQREKQQLEQELRIAREIQQALLPPTLPSQGWFVAAGKSESCFEVGGDYFDVIEIGSQRWGAVLADVSGKGVSAALLTSLLQGAFFSIYGSPTDVTAEVARLNRYILDRSRNARFATVFWCLIERDGTMRWINAGHCPAIVVRGTGIETLEPTTLPLGVVAEADLSASELRLAPGDRVVIYSDGVSEAVNWESEQFGEARIKQAVLKHANTSAAELFEALHSAVVEFVGGATQKDDMTLLVLGYQGE
jgi:serine phosphatase RsbU (regulator of sigma subunit)/pSer/pThr/pTyr-binding forkhead associated (FHA) protein